MVRLNQAEAQFIKCAFNSFISTAIRLIDEFIKRAERRLQSELSINPNAFPSSTRWRCVMSSNFLFWFYDHRNGLIIITTPFKEPERKTKMFWRSLWFHQIKWLNLIRWRSISLNSCSRRSEQIESWANGVHNGNWKASRSADESTFSSMGHCCAHQRETGAKLIREFYDLMGRVRGCRYIIARYLLR